MIVCVWLFDRVVVCVCCVRLCGACLFVYLRLWAVVRLSVWSRGRMCSHAYMHRLTCFMHGVCAMHCAFSCVYLVVCGLRSVLICVNSDTSLSYSCVACMHAISYCMYARGVCMSLVACVCVCWCVLACLCDRVFVASFALLCGCWCGCVFACVCFAARVFVCLCVFVCMLWVFVCCVIALCLRLCGDVFVCDESVFGLLVVQEMYLCMCVGVCCLVFD